MHPFKTILLLILVSVLTSCGPRVITPICTVYEYTGRGDNPNSNVIILAPAEWAGIHAALKKASQTPEAAFAIKKRNVFYLFPKTDSRSCMVLVPDGSDTYAYTGTVSWNGKLLQLDEGQKTDGTDPSTSSQ